MRPIRTVFALLVLLAPPSVRAQTSFLLATEAWNTTSPGLHGIAMVTSDLALGDGRRLRLEWNTDTVTARLSGDLGGVGLGLYARGEYLLAGLLQDYYRGGERVDEYGFDASYAETGVDARAGSGSHWFHGRLATRRWQFARNGTAASYALPTDFQELEAEAGYTFWAIDADASLSEAHRIASTRITGQGAGIRLVASLRSDDTDWGLGIRNRPAPLIPRVRQWATAGREVRDGLRLQARQEAGWGWGEDDLTRARVGGLNPYVVPIAGVPWAAFLSSRYVSARASGHVDGVGESEWVALIDAALVQDTDRNGGDDFSPVVGLGLGWDGRLGPWQIDAVFGYAPPLDWQRADGPLVSGFVSVGYRGGTARGTPLGVRSRPVGSGRRGRSVAGTPASPGPRCGSPDVGAR